MRWFIVMVCLVSFGFAGAFEQTLAKAKEEKKLVWVFVELPRCPWCARMRQEVIESGVYAKELAALYALVPLNREEAIAKELRAEHFPTSFLLNPSDGKVIDMLPGYMKSEDFVEYLKLLYEIERDDK